MAESSCGRGKAKPVLLLETHSTSQKVLFLDILCLSNFFLLFWIHCVISYYILTLDLPLAYGCGKPLGEFPYVLIVNLFCPILLASSVTSAG